MGTIILNLFYVYLFLIIGVVLQAFFLLLPVSFKNWDDDILYVITYIALQLFVAGLLFIVAPSVFETIQLPDENLVLLFAIVAFFAFLRVISIIPLEFTSAIKQEIIPEKELVFNDFFNSRRYEVLSTVSFKMPDGDVRYNAFREKIARLKRAGKESILEQMIGTKES